MKKFLSGFLIMALIVGTSSCSRTDNSDIESQTSEPTNETQESSEPSKITPTPTPTPTPETVYVPREALPEGQLFEEKYYAVLPGEGMYLYIYDCYGNIVHSFAFNDGESDPPLGLLEKYEIEQYTHFSDSGEAPEPKSNRRYFPGGYYEWPDWETHPEGSDEILRVVTDKGQTIIVHQASDDYSYAEWNMVVYPDSTGICILERVYSEDYSSEYLRLHYLEIKNDGTVLQNHSMDNLPFSPLQVVSGQYVIYTEYDGDYNEIGKNLMDLSGNILLKNVTPIGINFAGYLSESGVVIYIYDYFLREGRTYDSQLKPVPDDTRTSDGYFIPGVHYNVDGILCQTEIPSGWYDSAEENTYAAGTDGISKIAIASIWGDCVIQDVDTEKVRVLDVSSSMVLLSDYSVYSLNTGEFLWDIGFVYSYTPGPDKGHLSDEYLILSDYSFYSSYPIFIIHKDGKLSYYSDKSNAKVTGGGYILLKRGPYIGIADINGDWILKTVDPWVKRDGFVGLGKV